MSARDSILAAARRNQPVGAANAPASVPLPAIPTGRLDGDVLERFTAAVEAAGGRVVEAEAAEAGVRQAYPEAARVVSEADGVDGDPLAEDVRASVANSGHAPA